MSRSFGQRPTRTWSGTTGYGIVGFVVIILQSAVAAIPWALRRNWLILLATACGTLLTLGGGALPRWKAEKWDCRPKSPKTYCPIRGNGHQVVAIESAGMGMNLEDLACSRVRTRSYHRVLTGLLTISWTIFPRSRNGCEPYQYDCAIPDFPARWRGTNECRRHAIRH